jgi:hypothetical protein
MWGQKLHAAAERLTVHVIALRVKGLSRTSAEARRLGSMLNVGTSCQSC